MGLKAYKGFDKNMKCRGFQFAEGETYHEESAVLGKCGFHAFEMPIGVLSRYKPGDGAIYREVELDEVAPEKEDGERCGKTIKIGAELGIGDLVAAQIEWVKRRIESEVKPKWANRLRSSASHFKFGLARDPDAFGAAQATGDFSAAQTSGNYSAAQETGQYGAVLANGIESAAQATGACSAVQVFGNRAASQASGFGSAVYASGVLCTAQATGTYSAVHTSGHRGAAQANGDYSAAQASGFGSAAQVSGACSTAQASGAYAVATAAGSNCRVKGALGCALFAVEREEFTNEIISAAAAIVDGEEIKADTWYECRNGKLEEVN